jgi:exopolysaccharide production protein ExoY
MQGRERAATLRLRPFGFEPSRATEPATLPPETAAEAARKPEGWAGLRPHAKRAMDIAGSLVLLLLTSPIMLVLLLLARLEGGPAFYVHRRIGRGGVPFGCIKFRTMVPDAERRLAGLLARDPAARAEWQATRKLKADPRITRRGRVLRRTSLDELPQLINVLKGEMSLVGPRPVVQAELETLYGPAAPLYLSVRPGLTGPWQVSMRSDGDYARRVALDAAYVRHPSILTDIAILLRTVGAVLRRRGAY